MRASARLGWIMTQRFASARYRLPKERVAIKNCFSSGSQVRIRVADVSQPHECTLVTRRHALIATRRVRKAKRMSHLVAKPSNPTTRRLKRLHDATIVNYTSADQAVHVLPG